MVPVKTGITPVLDYPRRSHDRKGYHYVAERSLSRFTLLGSFAGCATDGSGGLPHNLRPARGGHSQEPFRLVGSRRYGLLEDRVRRARAVPPGASEVGWTRPGRVSRCGTLRARARGDELLDLPGLRPHTPGRCRYARVRRSSRCCRRRLPAGARPAMGRARRGRYPPARSSRRARGGWTSTLWVWPSRYWPEACGPPTSSSPPARGALSRVGRGL